MRDRERLRDLLIEHSLMFGEFTLASGKTSSFYFDSKKTTLLAEGSYLTAKEILRLLGEQSVRADAIGGMTLGADPIVCAVAAVSFIEGRPLPAFIVRKETKDHGTARRIEGNLAPGSRVVVVDDVVTTASSTLKAIEAVVQAGHHVAAVTCIVDREEGGTEHLASWPFYPLFSRSEIFASVDGRG
ncbi:MAG: orotate phosphoribosyltransferase [Acidobacteriota bacterium]|nr:orotate phosphoribosyltransferase [Acidobacteriota bacterium]